MAQISMDGIEQIAMTDTPVQAAPPAPPMRMPVSAPELGTLASLRAHWPEYLMEAALLGVFMVSACLFGALLEYPGSPVRQAVPSGFARRTLAGMAMGLTALGIFYSPWGKQSGAHINPAVTLTFFRLGKVKSGDAIFYVVAQFVGATLAVYLMALMLGRKISDPTVRYVVTVPGMQGPWVALLAEFLMAAGMMSAVLYFSNHRKLASLTGAFAATLVFVYITFEAPFSGMSINPARTFGSAVPSGVWDSFWVYLIAPTAGMLLAAEIYLWRQGRQAVLCCKLHHGSDKRCIFCGANGGFAL
jgi:aquaporin Z